MHSTGQAHTLYYNYAYRHSEVTARCIAYRCVWYLLEATFVEVHNGPVFSSERINAFVLLVGCGRSLITRRQARRECIIIIITAQFFCRQCDTCTYILCIDIIQCHIALCTGLDIFLCSRALILLQPKSLEAYRPPDWILQTKPALSPYLPQVGDIVSVVPHAIPTGPFLLGHPYL